ncbi:hypothetical protein LIER_41159 [Lithospermum erythrorhizon]|uniref:Uncharacterized protein n=1 Tax=Lithospermum erythrorhizon TaxID=34254 RepID=A0AAV3RAP4_LITER
MSVSFSEAIEAVDAEDDVLEAEESVPEEVSYEEDVASVMSKRRKAKGNLRMNENRTSVGNKRVPKNVVAVSTANMALNSEEEEVR